MIERLTATVSEITHIQAQFFTVTIKELPDENFGIGDHTLIGPDVKIYTPHHPMDYVARRERARNMHIL